ncbi:MAG: hypothetical protein Kow00120_17670 [Anaerolineae bacterium]
MSDTILPQVKLLISYDVLPGVQEAYYEFLVGELVPAAQHMGLYMREAWHTAFGDYPSRLAEFVAEDMATLQDILDSEEWRRLEVRFRSFTTDYSIKVVRFKRGFQF